MNTCLAAESVLQDANQHLEEISIPGHELDCLWAEQEEAQKELALCLFFHFLCC